MVWKCKHVCRLIDVPIVFVEVPYLSFVHAHHAQVEAARARRVEEEGGMESEKVLVEPHEPL